MNDKLNAQASPATPDSSDKTPVEPDCCTAPGGGDPGPGGPGGPTG
jgi:hypothetical protein